MKKKRNALNNVPGQVSLASTADYQIKTKKRGAVFRYCSNCPKMCYKTPISMESVSGGHDGAWGGPPGLGVGGQDGPGVSKSSYVGIASLNTSVRDKKNLLEIRLDRKDFSVSFNLGQPELDHLLTRLGIDSSHFTGVSCCPEGKGVVYVTLHPSVNIQRFLNRSECFELKEGIRTGTIRPAGKKEQSVTISGLHPNTKDQAVVKYLSAHGKVSTSDRVIHHVYPGAPGSSLCAGKLNGNRSYMVEVTKPMGSYHIIDGEKVSVKYRGQARTCARCHKTDSGCPGKAIARDCTSTRVLLSTHMEEHWEKVGYKPDTEDLNEVDDLDIQVGMKAPEPAPASLRPDHSEKYSSVLINGFSKTAEEKDIYDILIEGGLPDDYTIENIKKNDKNGQLIIDSLEPAVCASLTNHIHGKKFFNRKVYVTSVVEKTPAKETEDGGDSCPNSLVGTSGSESSSDDDDGQTASKPPCSKLFTNISEQVKRPAGASPEEASENKKNKKKKPRNDGSSSTAVRSSSRHGRPSTKK